MSLHWAVTVIKYAGQRFSAKKCRIKYMYVLYMHVRLTHAKYMYYYWANWGLLIGITCNINSGTPITITWRYLNVLEIRYIQRICFLAAISHQSTHYSKTLKTTTSITQCGKMGNFLHTVVQAFEFVH